jgi:hypothetical protein
MTTLEQRIQAILAIPNPTAPARAEEMRRLATPLSNEDIIRLLSASAAVCQALREAVDAVKRRARARAPKALYALIRQAERDGRLWFDGFYIDENGKLLLRLRVRQYDWVPEHGGFLAPQIKEAVIPADEVLDRGEERR